MAFLDDQGWFCVCFQGSVIVLLLYEIPEIRAGWMGQTDCEERKRARGNWMMLSSSNLATIAVAWEDELGV